MDRGSEGVVELGRVSGASGIRGWVKVFSHTRPREAIGEYAEWLLGRPGDWQAMAVEGCRPQGRTVVAKLAGIDGREQAEALTGSRIAVRESQLPPLEDDEFYWRDMIGLRVATTEGIDLGVVDHLIETGANDVLVVKGDRERLIPFTMGHAVVQVDAAAGQITVDWDPDF